MYSPHELVHFMRLISVDHVVDGLLFYEPGLRGHEFMGRLYRLRGLPASVNISEGALKPDFQLAIYESVRAPILPVRCEPRWFPLPEQNEKIFDADVAGAPDPCVVRGVSRDSS